ncbi:MAG: AFG1 family ATPase [Rhizobiaceae bacterium]|nr:AFG1 family ATPase [Rhizobiaceae bacterium]MCV0404637.1 AFG1 family ATPase [Rhizobiaceae bacterium]
MSDGPRHVRDGLVAHPSVLNRYDHLVETGQIRTDEIQREVARRLDRLIATLADKRLAAKASALGWLFGRKNPSREPVKGLYLHGGVGRGKTMLMDLFFELVPVRRKRRVHFNDFMSDVHDRIAAHRLAVRNGDAKGDDPIAPVAKAIADEAWVLCFDEFSVTDIADAMILSRLFSALFGHGVVLVATSNVAPRDLYRDGLNRQLFTPFIATLEKHADILPLNGDTDYRLEKLSRLPVWITPLGPNARRVMDEAWEAAAAGLEEHPIEITLRGRRITVPRAAHRAARFTFAQLCDEPLGAVDFLAIADRFDTILIDDVPVLDQSRRNATKRFILLVDTLYDRGIRLIASAEATPDALYAGRPGTTEAFEFDRTASRLIEMQSRDWRENSSRRLHAEF